MHLWCANRRHILLAVIFLISSFVVFSRLNMQFARTEEQSLSLKGRHGAISKIMFIFILGSKSNGLVLQNVYKKLNDNSCLVKQSVHLLDTWCTLQVVFFSWAIWFCCVTSIGSPFMWSSIQDNTRVFSEDLSSNCSGVRLLFSSNWQKSNGLLHTLSLVKKKKNKRIT